MWKSDSAYDTFESTVLMGPRGGYSPCLANLKSSILERAPQNQERQFLSVDCTFKLCEEECVPFLLSCGSSRVQGSYPKRSSYGGPTEFVQPTRFVQAFQFSRKLKNLESNSEANACCNSVKCHLKCVLNLIQGLHTFHFFPRADSRHFCLHVLHVRALQKRLCAGRGRPGVPARQRKRAFACVCVRVRAFACLCVHVCAFAHACIRVHVCVLARLRACVLGCVRACVLLCSRPCRCTPTRAYTHVQRAPVRTCAWNLEYMRVWVFVFERERECACVCVCVCACVCLFL